MIVKLNYKNYLLGEIVKSQLSPNSPTKDSSSESNTRPRLQRSMGQSKRTFRLRKSRKSHIEVIKNLLIFIFYKI